MNEGFFGNALSKASAAIGFNRMPSDPNVPKNGDRLVHHWISRQQGANVLADSTEGIVFIAKDGSVHLQYDNGLTSKVANNVGELKKSRNPLGGWEKQSFLS